MLISSSFPIITLYAPLFSPVYATCLSQSGFDPWIILDEEYKSWSFSLCSVLRHLVTAPFKAEIAPLARNSETPLAYVSPSLWDTKFSHSHKTTGKLYFCIF
jgi:2-keto-3-deoxy-L-rhamnonate aldolase RhmA